MGQRHDPGVGGDDEVARGTSGSRVRWRGRGRATGLVAVATLAAVMVALGVLAPRTGLFGGGSTPGLTPGALPPVHPYAGPRGQWVAESGLTGGSVPELSPLDPNIAYQAMYDTNPPYVRRSDDGGATWHKLPSPSVAGLSPVGTPGAELLAFPSPLDAATVFLVINAPATGGMCPSAPSTEAHAVGPLARTSGIPYCQFSYISRDGGVHWRHVALPDGDRGFLGGDSGLRPLTAVHRVIAQGSRLYAFDHVEGQGGVSGYLVASDDGGLTWRAIDTSIRARGQSVLDYAGARDGSTLFAVSLNPLTSSPFELWRSADGGAQWALVRDESFASFGGLAVVPSPAGQTPLLYVAAHMGSGAGYPANATDFHVSQDGGQTWHDAPTGGIPAVAVDLMPGILGVLGDGSIVVQTPAGAPSGPVGLEFYAWRVGQPSWRHLTPSVEGEALFTITPAGPVGPEALWVEAPNMEVGKPGFMLVDVQRYVLP